MKEASSHAQPGHPMEEARTIVERVDVVAARRTLRLEPELDGMSHELGVELAAVRVVAETR
jgi:hypothetical protein